MVRTCGGTDEIGLDPHRGGIERREAEVRYLARVVVREQDVPHLPTEKSGNIFRVGIFLDFVRLTTTMSCSLRNTGSRFRLPPWYLL